MIWAQLDVDVDAGAIVVFSQAQSYRNGQGFFLGAINSGSIQRNWLRGRASDIGKFIRLG
ncbi:hypothetical protein HYFRA_00004187 [Hymenoscyphus fraxineus]|uniref:Uncharacterized protein n=1 Tax=Hymenoscyphus fraxineus TaxID=746836 RepID=A0A9N9KLE1_9HELO|nr:hypothetical protein HYFRA_00004187 [Hymenoscyphus fraxineus]